jgi:hypothetical protein
VSRDPCPPFHGKTGRCTLPLQIDELLGHMRHANGDALGTAAEIARECDGIRNVNGLSSVDSILIRYPLVKQSSSSPTLPL